MARTILTDKEWETIKPFIPENNGNTGKKSHPAHDHRRILEAILWVLRTGAARCTPRILPLVNGL
jgi:transposase